MLFLHDGPENIEAWTILVRGRWYVLAPTDIRPGGPVVFTEAERAHEWLSWQERRGRPVIGAEVQKTRGTLGESIEIWRQLFDGLGYQPQHYSVCIIDPRPAVHPAHDLDGEAVPLDPVLLPEGVVVL